MASSSSINEVCFYCKSPSDQFYDGWPLRLGGRAMLCHRCFTAYIEGTFCATFHPDASGWRNCSACNKRLHCGCIMAAFTHAIMDYGGVKCIECAIYELLLTRHEVPPRAGGSPKRQSINPEKLITVGRTISSSTLVALIDSEADPIAAPDSVEHNVSPGKNSEADPIAAPDSVQRNISPGKNSEADPIAAPDSVQRNISPGKNSEAVECNVSPGKNSEADPIAAPDSVERNVSPGKNSEADPIAAPDSVERNVSPGKNSEADPISAPDSVERNVSPGKNSEADPIAACDSVECNVSPGKNSEADPIAAPDSVERNVSPGKTATPATPGAVLQEQSPSEGTAEESSLSLPDKTDNGGKRQRNYYFQIQFRYLPKISSQELNEICRATKLSLIPLFEKELTATDADPRNGRLVVPKRCAEAFLPQISREEGTFVVIQDTSGKNWELYYHFWSNVNGKMYVLEGLKDYIISMQCQAGDIDS
ncbi:hypothetical protein PTKIN_Ptkin14bG0097900 [Pterospermum kingtungense]